MTSTVRGEVRRPMLGRALAVMAFGVGAALAAGAGILGGLLAGLWIGLPAGIVVGTGVMVTLPTAFVVLSRRLLGVPTRPGLALLWQLVALLGALLVQLVSGNLLAASGSPYVSPPVIAVVAVFVASLAVAIVDSNSESKER